MGKYQGELGRVVELKAPSAFTDRALRQHFQNVLLCSLLNTQEFWISRIPISVSVMNRCKGRQHEKQFPSCFSITISL